MPESDASLQELIHRPLYNMDMGYFSEMIHTGFRKGMESPWATLIWNSINHAPSWLWEDFLTDLKRQFVSHGVSGQGIIHVFSNYSLDMYKFRERHQDDDDVDSHKALSMSMVFVSAINLINQRDADLLSSWVLFCVGRLMAEEGSK